MRATVAIINSAAARRFFPDRLAIGAHIRLWGASRQIVGVVADERFQGIVEAPPIAVYAPTAQVPSADGAGVLLLRAQGDPSGLMLAAAAAIRDVDRGLAVFGVEPLRATLSRSMGQRRFTMVLLTLFGALALVLAAIGIHGVLSYGVSQRGREIGIRKALGARGADLVSLIVREGLSLAAIGLAVGFGGAFVLTRFLRSQLFGVAPTDPATFGAVAALLAVVAIGATLAPARRAVRVDPIVTLRSE